MAYIVKMPGQETDSVPEYDKTACQASFASQLIAAAFNHSPATAPHRSHGIPKILFLYQQQQ